MSRSPSTPRLGLALGKGVSGSGAPAPWKSATRCDSSNYCRRKVSWMSSRVVGFGRGGRWRGPQEPKKNDLANRYRPVRPSPRGIWLVPAAVLGRTAILRLGLGPEGTILYVESSVVRLFLDLHSSSKNKRDRSRSSGVAASHHRPVALQSVYGFVRLSLPRFLRPVFALRQSGNADLRIVLQK